MLGSLRMQRQEKTEKMYCVRCGVRLPEGEESCPLCGTPVWNPEGETPVRTYPDSMPSHYREADLPGALVMTVLCLIAEAVLLTVCLKLYGEQSWGGYAVLGVLLFYIVAVLPRWFRHPKGEIFVPVDHAAAALYVLYVCVRTGGSWFMSFALPVLACSCLLSTAMICLLKYVGRGRLYIFGGFLILLGGFTVLVEFLEHISFGTVMFQWSLYSLSGFVIAGLMLLVTALIPPLRHELEKRFFI